MPFFPLSRRCSCSVAYSVAWRGRAEMGLFHIGKVPVRIRSQLSSAAQNENLHFQASADHVCAAGGGSWTRHSNCTASAVLAICRDPTNNRIPFSCTFTPLFVVQYILRAQRCKVSSAKKNGIMLTVFQFLQGPSGCYVQSLSYSVGVCISRGLYSFARRSAAVQTLYPAGRDASSS